MPQPYRGDGEFYFAGADASKSQELLALIASLSNLWTFSEDIWGIILATMLGIQGEAGLAMYHSLVGTAAQRAVLGEMADRYMPDSLKADFQGLLRAMKGRAKERNEIVHGLWFLDPKIPDAMILLPRNSISGMWSRGQKEALSRIFAGAEVQPSKPPMITKGWLTYKKVDFENAIVRLLEFTKDQDDLFDRLLAAKGLPPFGTPARPTRS